MPSSRLVRKKYSINSVSWFAIVAPIECNGIVIKNLDSSDIKLRSDSEDPTSEDVLPGFSVEPTLLASAHQRTDARFPQGSTVCYAQSTDIEADIVVAFVY